MNPNAIVLWAICGILGYLSDGTHGALVGILIGLCISLLVEFLPTGRR